MFWSPQISLYELQSMSSLADNLFYDLRTPFTAATEFELWPQDIFSCSIQRAWSTFRPPARQLQPGELWSRVACGDGDSGYDAEARCSGIVYKML